MKDNYSRLKEILREMFQMDQADLDFGIYRIMNQKRAEVEEFLEKDLLPQVKEAFAEYTSVDRLRIEEQLKKLRKTLEDAGVEPDTAPKYKELQQELSNSVDIEALEQEVYSKLVSFFSRYYENGDFMSRPRYKDGTYAIPYKGEEVKLHWANSDQYYVKTTEYFRDYTFVLPSEQKVHFKIIDASTEQNNNKEESGKERRFVLCEDKPVSEENGELIFNFHYKINPGKQAKLNEAATDYIKANADKDPIKKYIEIFAPAPTESNPARTLIEKHINDYTARNTYDYFIHKDLGAFLRRELDFYFKNEILFIDDIENRTPLYFQQSISKVKVIKKIALKIIAFLEQLENFQKRLWLKKKFVVETNYCITLDRIPQELYKEILANKEQIDEWKKLFAIEEIEGYKEPLTNKFLKDNPFLVLDTAFFDQEFKDKLLASIDDVEEQMNGLLIHSENFQALNLLQERYKGQIKCIYIDPPYNTDASKILYKNGYEHSSWLSLMHTRLERAKKLLNIKGIIEVAIDDYEFRYTNCCLDQVFGVENAISNIAVFTNPKGRDQGFIAQAHDYTLLYANDKKMAETNNFILTEEEIKKKFSKLQGEKALRELPLKRTGTGKRREERPYMYFPFVYDVANKKLNVIPEEEYKKIYNPLENTFDDLFIEELREKYEKYGWQFILPLSSKNEKLRWRWGYKSCMSGVESGMLFAKELRTGSYAVYQYDFADEEATPKSMWIGEKYDASSKGTNLLENIIPNNPFNYPKSLFTVLDNIIIGSNEQDILLDYFAGSGTTGHAIIDLNRETNSKRKYILVEMGEYFDTVLKERIQKVIYSKDWGGGRPLYRKGCSHMFKYIRLESYEDTLNNLELKRNEYQQQALGENAEIKEQFILSYMLDIESQGSSSLLDLDLFDDPFNYKLKINRNGENKTAAVDLAETFNYLLGLKVQQTEFIRGFKVVRGELLNGEKVLIIWRNLKEKTNEDLDKFFKKQDYNTLDFDFDRIYVNGDNNLQNIKKDEERWKVFLIEQEFTRLMFDVQDI